MTVTSRRGCPLCPMSAAPPTAPTPPAASTRPKVPAEPWRSVFTTNGSKSSAEHGPEQPQGDRTDQLVERVGRGEVLTGDKLGDDRLERRREERRSDPVDRDERNQVPEAERVHEDEDRESADRRRAQGVRPH